MKNAGQNRQVYDFYSSKQMSRVFFNSCKLFLLNAVFVCVVCMKFRRTVVMCLK